MSFETYQYSATHEQLSEISADILNTLGLVRIIGFEGDLGSGKTTLIKSFCQLLGSDDEVSSPTYSIVNEYELPTETLYHMDLYRLKSIEECLDIGLEEYLFSGKYCLIEWPQIAETLFELPFGKINIEILDNFTRRINLIIHR